MVSKAAEGVRQARKNNVLERKMKRSTTHPASIFAAAAPATVFISCFARRVEGAIEHQFWQVVGCGGFAANREPASGRYYSEDTKQSNFCGSMKSSSVGRWSEDPFIRPIRMNEAGGAA